MEAIQINKTGGTEVLEFKTDVAVPTPKDGEVLIKNEYLGVNYIDTYFRTGLYPTPGFPYTLGREGAGTIAGTGSGEVYGLKEGDRVAYIGMGGYAQYTATSALQVHKIPDNIPTDKAAATLLQGLTAITLIRDAHNVKAGEWILVHAAAGGMGLWLCQLLKVTGAHVIGTASTEDKRSLAKKAGAEVVLEYPETMGDKAFVSKVKELTGGKGVHAIFDGVGKATFDTDLDVIALKGSLISFGNASGAVPPLTINRLSPKNVRLMRPTLFGFISTREEFEKNTQDLFEIMEKENLDVSIHKTYDLKDVASAHQDLEGRRTTGKLVLKV